MQGRGPIYCDLTTGTEDEVKFCEWSISHEGGGTSLLHLMQRDGIDLRRDKLEMGPGEVELGNFAAADFTWMEIVPPPCQGSLWQETKWVASLSRAPQAL